MVIPFWALLILILYCVKYDSSQNVVDLILSLTFNVYDL
jgi:hypothetical protein